MWVSLSVITWTHDKEWKWGFWQWNKNLIYRISQFTLYDLAALKVLTVTASVV
jgi:hypothetical protein